MEGKSAVAIRLPPGTVFYQDLRSIRTCLLPILGPASCRHKRKPKQGSA